MPWRPSTLRKLEVYRWKLEAPVSKGQTLPFSYLENQTEKQQTISASVVAFSARTLYFED